eukprot:CAMPEP_0172363532 /NCGR_PEP_ID=MMETSP1060-20121228/6863_1 /TAXON_ID=37318 /ORGANISM="Pseudo-nitzschia pungens, Strain cf. cingulata" /LENGTH=348 /DNA_ID=CAMNT_0013086285 /DNA_START=246 /DNA_END=1292 /DNA_ORIENTATION=+
MKHPRDDEDPPLMLMGSDHSKAKRPRTDSDASESSAIENKSNIVNANSSAFYNLGFHRNAEIRKEITHSDSSSSPRMMALLYSLDDEARQLQLQHNWPQPTASNPVPAPAPTPVSASATQAAAALLHQKNEQQAQTTEFRYHQPLSARPLVHKIKEVSPTLEAQNSQPGSRDSPAPSLAPSPSTLDSIKSAVAAAAAAAATASTQDNSVTTAAVNTALEQHRIAGAALAAAKTGVSATRSAPSATSVAQAGSFGRRTPNHPLHAFSFPTHTLASGGVISSTRYDATHLHHGSRPHSIRGPTARQQAIHNAVHSDYKKIYRPLQRPPRLPTPQEALVIAAISTATPPCR